MDQPPHARLPTSTDPTSATPAPATASNGRLARMIVVLCFLITTVATALIYWRWANVTEPSSYVVVQGEKEHNGTVVVVSADRENDTVAMATLAPDNHYSATIFLQPGTYTLTATQNGEILIHGELWMAYRRWKMILLRPRASAK